MVQNKEHIAAADAGMAPASREAAIRRLFWRWSNGRIKPGGGHGFDAYSQRMEAFASDVRMTYPAFAIRVVGSVCPSAPAAASAMSMSV